MTNISSQRNALSRASTWIFLGFLPCGLPQEMLILSSSHVSHVFAYGSSTLILAVYFSVLGIVDEQIGLFMTLTLLGDVLVSLLVSALGRPF